MADISMEKLIALRTLIDTKLRDEGVYTQLRSLIQGTHGPDAAISNVLQSDIVTQLIESIKDDKNLLVNCDETEPKCEEKAICNENTVLHVRLLGGRAFIDCIETTGTSQSRQCFRVDLAFCNQRCSSNEAICCVEPAFDATFLITLPSTIASTFEIIPKWEALCRLREPLHLTLVKVLQKQVDGQWETINTELVAAAKLDWRRVMSCSHATAHFPIQLEGPLKLAAGILDIRLDLIPFRKSTAIGHDVAQYLQKELLTINAIHTQFYQYAKQWWEEFTLEHEQNKARSIKIFTEDETHRYRMVCTYLTPLQSRYLSTPSEAARFVSLIPFVRSVAIGGGGRQDGWKSLPTFLALGKGDCEEHTILLVSLLLGFGLDAYVALGSIRSKMTATIVPHTWAIVKEKSGVMNWESVTGVRYRLSDQHPYESIDCLFNNNNFFAYRTKAPPREMSFDLYDTKHWKRMENNLLKQLQFQAHIALIPPRLESNLEEQLECQLRSQLNEIRLGYGYSTNWDSVLSHYLRPALASYELERTYGIGNLENDHFEMSIKSYVPEGYTFQGCPVFTSSSITITPSLIAQKVLAEDTAQSMLKVHARNTQFGLAVRCIRYPERITAIWVMLGVTYKST